MTEPTGRRREGYVCEFTIPDTDWSGTDTIQTERQRARKRHTIRTYAKRQWRQLKKQGAAWPVNRFVALIGVAYPNTMHTFPARAAETIKPIIDAGTDTGLWPDDDASHRCSTIYFPLPAKAPRGQYRLQVIILPVPSKHPTYQIAGALGQQTVSQWGSDPERPDWYDGYGLRLHIPNRIWLSSNLTDSELAAIRSTGTKNKARWGKPSFGVREDTTRQLTRHALTAWRRQADNYCGYERFVILAGVGYAGNVGVDEADPDNCAESVNAILQAGTIMRAWHGLESRWCKGVAFFRLPFDSVPGTHDVHLIVLPVPDTFQLTAAVAESTMSAWSEYDERRRK